RDVVQNQLLGHTAAQAGNDVLEHLALGDVRAVLLGQVHGVAAGLAARDDGDLMDAGMVLAVEARHRVARLVVGGQFLFLGGHDPALLLGAGHDLHRSLLDVLHRDGLAVAAGSQQGRLVRFSRSAPAKPAVRWAITLRDTSGARGFLRVWTFRISSRPLTSGRPTYSWRSKRPGRSRALSRMSARLVAAMTMMPSLASKPSISTSSWFKVCSRSS